MSISFPDMPPPSSSLNAVRIAFIGKLSFRNNAPHIDVVSPTQGVPYVTATAGPDFARLQSMAASRDVTVFVTDLRDDQPLAVEWADPLPAGAAARSAVALPARTVEALRNAVQSGAERYVRNAVL